MEQVLLVWGDPAAGFTYVGPVTTNDPDLEAFIERYLHDRYWWYVPLTSLAQATAEAPRS